MNNAAENKEEWISGDYVAAVIDDQRDLESAVQQLREKGFSKEAIRVYAGRADAKELANLGGEGLIGTIRRTIDDFAGNAKELTDRLEVQTARGQHVVMVPLAEGADVDEVRRVLLSHGAHDMMGRIGGFTSGWVEGGFAAG